MEKLHHLIRFIVISIFLACIILSGLAPAVAADEEGKVQKPEKLWKARLELGYTETSGNTDTTSFSGKLNFTHEARRDRYYLKAESLYSKDSGVETANRFSTEASWEHTISGSLFFTAITAGYLTDTYAGYNSRIYGGPGMGYDVIKTDDQHLKTLLSAIYYVDDYTGTDPDEDKYWSGQVRVDYRLNITKGLVFKQNVEYTAKLSDTHKYFVDSGTSLEAAISSYLSMGLNYTVNYQNEPPPGVHDTDRKFMGTLIFTL
jgi:putative salt-induced outer membrane protein